MLNGESLTLKEYLKLKDLNIKEFSKKIDYSRAYINMMMTGSLEPTKKILRTIERVTDGMVTAENAFLEAKKAKEASQIPVEEEKYKDCINMLAEV